MNAGVKLLLFGAASVGAAATPLSGRSAMEADVLEEVNFLRGNPPAFARELEEFTERFDGNIILGEGDEPDMITNEGSRAVAEAARELRRAKPLGSIEHDEILTRAAADHVRSQGQSGQVGHYSNGKGPGQRVKARGGNIYVGEVIVYGFIGPQGAVRQLVVDDGVPSRGHRKLLMTGAYRYAGVACGDHKLWRNMCVIVLSETKNGAAPLAPRDN